MSVTFSVPGGPTDVERYDDEDGVVEFTFGVLDVNMSNANAVRAAEALGIALADDGWCGEMDAQDFLGRVLMAQALSPLDEGMPAYEHVGPGARMVEGARRPGYLQERLGDLHKLATWGVKHGVQVQWS